jgi:hypothetical protein
MAAIVFTLLGLMALVLARAAGLNWQDILHWTGELLLVLGILLAAKGISDVRREWTGLPGFWGIVKQKTQPFRIRAASFMWAYWNQVVKWAWLAKPLHLRPHERGITAVGGVAMAKASVSATAEVIWGPPPVTGTTEDRLAWLEGHMVSAGERLRELDVWRQREVADRQAATEEERAARVAEDQRIREDMADLAGGGLRLQAWGVACLLAGTVMTAIW